MRRLGLLAVSLLAGFGCTAENDPGPDFRDGFIEACLDDGISLSTCGCIYDEYIIQDHSVEYAAQVCS